MGGRGSASMGRNARLRAVGDKIGVGTYHVDNENPDGVIRNAKVGSKLYHNNFGTLYTKNSSATWTRRLLGTNGVEVVTNDDVSSYLKRSKAQLQIVEPKRNKVSSAGVKGKNKTFSPISMSNTKIVSQLGNSPVGSKLYQVGSHDVYVKTSGTTWRNKSNRLFTDAKLANVISSTREAEIRKPKSKRK